MNTKVFLLPLSVLTLLVFSTISTSRGIVVTFDDLSESGSGAWFSFQYQGYRGLTWNGIACNNAILLTNVLPHEFPGAPTNGLSGDFYGMVSASNVAEVIRDSDFGPDPEIDSTTNFNFLGAYLTGAWNSNLNIEVQGFSNTNLLYDRTVIASATNSTLFAFNYLDINRLVFISSGGQPAFGLDYAGMFIMDNFNFEFVPEPSPLLLTGAAAFLLWPLLKRKRA